MEHLVVGQAAQDLDISQALLSHYEKGIRECNLDFVNKAARYYGVTADFLLGLTESKRGLGDIYAGDAIETDAEISPKSVIRSLIFLSERAAWAGDEAVDFFTDYFSLCVKKYAEILNGDAKQRRLSELSIQYLTDDQRVSRGKSQDLSQPSAAADTVLTHAQHLVNDTFDAIIKR